MFLARTRVLAALALLLAAPLIALGQTTAWSSADRAAALAVLSETTGQSAANGPDSQLEDELTRLALAQTGQRVAPTSVDRLWAIAPARRDVAAELAAARREGRLEPWLRSLSPPYPAYRALESFAARYRALVAQGGWKPLPAGSLLGAGDRDPAVMALRARLALEGYATAGADPASFDRSLAAALATYQADRSLPVSGRLDAATRMALDTPAAARLATLEANLERWRWLPRELPATRFELDIAAAEGRLIVGGVPTLEMRAVVGDLKHKTPMFISALTSVVFDPPWNVPQDIAAEEILPKAARDPGYLSRNDFVLIDGRVQQRPGPKNALGSVKFDLASPFGVYLHDTPAKALFAQSRRTLSHGCMRLEKPQALAEALLGAQGWTSAAVSQAMAAGHTQATPLHIPVPLYVLYWTADVSPAGHVRFRPDVYGWDRELLNALAHVAAPTALPGPPPAACDA